LIVLRTQPILRQVFATAVTLLVLLGVLAAWSAFKTRAERADEVQAEAGAIARTAVTLLNEYFSSLDAIASTLSRDNVIRSLDPSGATRALQAVLSEQPLLGNITLRGPDGVLVASAVPFTSQAPPAADTTMLVLRTGQPATSQLVIGPILQRRTVLLAYPVRRDRGPVVGVLSFSLDLPRLESVFSGVQLPEGSVVALADQRNLIIARSVESGKYIGSPLEAPKGSGSTSFQTDADGVQRFHGNATIDRGPWLLSVAIPRAEVLRRLAPLWRRNITLIAIALACVIGLTFWISWHTAFTLRRLRDAAHRIAGGDFSPPEQKPVHNREMHQLQLSFVTMAERLRTAREALEQQLDAVRTLQRQIVRQERLAAVGLLVSGVAHELNNPLQAIMGNIEVIERTAGLSDEVVESIAFVKAQSDRANDIIRSLARFSRGGAGTPALIGLQDVIAEVLQLRKRELERVPIAVQIETSTTRMVFATFAELEQVLLNFVVNAQQAIESSGRNQGRIRIRLADAGVRIRLEVADDGPGVPADDEPKLFQPFFTTKPVGYGTGLGLSVSYGIINAYGGVIGYSLNEWGGSTFYFELPAAATREGQSTNDGAALLHRRAPSGV